MRYKLSATKMRQTGRPWRRYCPSFVEKYVKAESKVTAKHKWHRLGFDPNTRKLPDFLQKLNQGAERAFGENAQAMIEPHLSQNAAKGEKLSQYGQSGKRHL